MGNCCSYLSNLLGWSNYQPINDNDSNSGSRGLTSLSASSSGALKSGNKKTNHKSTSSNISPSSSSSTSKITAAAAVAGTSITTTSTSTSSPSSLTAASPKNGSIAIPSSLQGITSTYQPQLSSTQVKTGFFITYDLKEEIGVGSTSKCYRCVRKSDKKEFACKLIDKRQVEMKFTGLLEQFFVEIKVLKALKHPNIIHIEDSFETPDRIYMVMEMMKGGELFDYVVEKGTLSEEEASVLVRKITSAVAHMHGLGIIHRDLKPENLLLTSKGDHAEVKLIDFGLAKEMDDQVARSFLGTRGYLAPEMLQRTAYDKAIDIWALGIIVFVLLCGCLPFDDDSSRIASESDARVKFTLRFPPWATNLSSSAQDLLHKLLDVNPKTRYTAEQALNHPWVSGKSVTPNNYLKSPCLIGERRFKSPRTPSHILSQVRGLDKIVEESDDHDNYQRHNKGTSRNTAGLPRKNSI